MTEESKTEVNKVKIDNKFIKKALNETGWSEKEQASADYNRDGERISQQSAEYFAKEEKEHAAWQAKHDRESRALKTVGFYMEQMKYSNPELAKQANLYLNNLVKKDDLDIKRELWGNKTIDLDGSKKTFFGRLKNRVRNFMYPFNTKNALETAISELRDDMVKNPEFYNAMKMQLGKEENITFKGMVDQNAKDSKYYNDERVDAMVNKEEWQERAVKNREKAQSHEAVVDAIARVNKLHKLAHENVGIEDTGVDKLEERAKAMEGMSPEQRTAYRISMLRGAAKEAPKPAQKREIAPSTLAKAVSNAKTNA